MRFRASFAAVALALALLAHTACFAQAHPARFDRGLLWKVEKSGRPVSYLFGTVHIPDPRLLDLSPAVLGAFKAAEQVATEIAMDMSNLERLMTAMLYTDGRTLESVAGAELYRELVAIMSRIGVAESLTQRLKPWAAMTMLIVPPRNDALPMDMALYQAAAQAGKKQAALESIDEQVALFESQSLEDQLVLLRDVITNYHKVAEATRKMVRSYLDRNLGELNALAASEDLLGTKESREVNRRLMERMISRRNVVMADRLEPLLERSSTFAAVGALHLPGADGLLMLLERRGYRVSRADE